MQSFRRPCILCGQAAWPLKRVNASWTPRWLTIDKGEGTFHDHEVLCGACVEKWWYESERSLRREGSDGEHFKHRRSQRHCKVVGEDVARELARNPPDDPWKEGGKKYDTSTRVTIRGKYWGESEAHDNSSSEEDAAARPMSMDSDQ